MRGPKPSGSSALVSKRPDKALAVTSDTCVCPPDAPIVVRQVFDTVVADLGPHLKQSDAEAIVMLATAAYRHRQATAQIEEDGTLLVDGRAHPMLKVEKDSAATYLRLADHFGLTPAARIRIGLMQLAGESILADLNAMLES